MSRRTWIFGLITHQMWSDPSAIYLVTSFEHSHYGFENKMNPWLSVCLKAIWSQMRARLESR